MVLKKKLFEEFQDGCLVHGHLWYLNGMIAAMLAHNNDSVGCESTIPSLMPYKLSHCALQICRWFLEF